MNYLEVINIASKFDAKGFKQAETALGKLASTTKKLAGAAGIAYGASAITAYGKAAVKAFADDEAAALRLNRAVENLGIGFANPAIADYIANLEKSAAVADDILRPAFQGLLTTTGSLIQSQKLLSDAITISRASGIDLATVTEDLGKGYVGITRGLAKYNTGLTRAELTSKSFNEILGTILKRSAGAAEDYLDTTAYKFDVLSVATSNASEIIGGGLVDAFALVGGGTDANDAAYVIEGIATALSKVTVQAGRTIGVIPTLIQNLKNLPRNIFAGFAGAQLGINIAIPQKKEEVKLTLTQKKQEELMAKLEKDSLRRERERLALKNKQLATDKAKAIIAQGENALLKGNEIFDMDKIQIAAALTNQAEQLGKATTSSQALQIANDTARLNVKRSILAVEDAIASKDEAAIDAAVKRLNADLGILGALNNQKLTLGEIDKLIKSLQATDLKGSIQYTDNITETLNKLRDLYSVQIDAENYLTALKLRNIRDVANAENDTLERKLRGYSASALALASLAGAERQAAIARLSSEIGTASLIQGIQAGMTPAEAAVGARYAAQAAFNYYIEITTGIGDPNAIAAAVNDVITQAQQRGTLVGGVFAA